MLSIEQKATNFDTFRHIERVRNLINLFVIELLKRGEDHDQTKLEMPELEGFTKKTKDLSDTTYGSKEYGNNLESQELKKALEHHYAQYRHHPQHFKNGINDMNLIDLVEMFLDWKASSERHNNGNILNSIEYNADRFGISPQLSKILQNTAEVLDK